MNFDWKGYVMLSEELVQRTEEACLRSAISRSYYGVFCLARNKLNYQWYSGRDIHGKVINIYMDSTDVIQGKIGKNLDELRKARNIADYNDNREIKKEMAERMVMLARQVLKNLETI